MLASLASFFLALVTLAPLHSPAIGISVNLVPPDYPVQTSFTASGPYATTTATVLQGGQPAYDLFYPSDYASLGFLSPIVTWGNGSDAVPAMYTTLLNHFASWGFTVIASTLENTGSGREIDAAAHYLVQQDATPGSVFDGKLDPHHVAAVGHSQGATGATRAATSDPGLITTLMTFSLPSTIWSGANPDCATAADCTPSPALMVHPVFFISSYGPLDTFIANAPTERAYFDSVHQHAVSGLIATSEGAYADHNSVQNAADGGNPGGELGYATAWLEYQLLGNTFAAGAFSGPDPEITHNLAWPGSKVK